MATLIIRDGTGIDEIVSCPECERPARVVAAQLRAGVVLMGCAGCSHTFTYALPQPA